MTSEELSQTPPASGWVFVAFGAAVAALGLLVLVVLEDDAPAVLGWVLLGAGGLGCAIGATAVGVTVALRRADWLRATARPTEDRARHTA